MKYLTCQKGLVIDISGGNIRNNEKIIVYPKHGGRNQQFKLTNRGNGYHSIDLINTDYCLDITGGGSPKNGTGIILYKYHGGSNQLWMTGMQDGNNEKIMYHSKADNSMVLDVNRGTNDLIVWEAHGNENQIFEWQD